MHIYIWYKSILKHKSYIYNEYIYYIINIYMYIYNAHSIYIYCTYHIAHSLQYTVYTLYIYTTPPVCSNVSAI